MPPETLKAYRDHGKPALRLEENTQVANDVLESLAEVGIDLDALTHQLEDEGVMKFIKSLNKLMTALREKHDAALQTQISS